MSTAALVYLNPALPVRIENADRLVYLPDGSQHVLDKHDRPLFSTPPGTGVSIVMEYAVDEDPTEAQVAPFAREEHKTKLELVRREESAAEQTQAIQQINQEDMVNVNRSTGVASPVVPIQPVWPLHQRRGGPFPTVAEFTPRPVMQPGEVKVQTSDEVSNDATGEMVVPGFPPSPQKGDSESEETSKTDEHDREAG